MKLTLLAALSALLLNAQADPAADAIKAWDAEHRTTDFQAREQSLFEVSAEWVSKWPDSKLAWDRRRESLVGTQNHNAELWKQVDENLIRLSPPHSFATTAAHDWVVNHINVKEGEALLVSEIQYLEGKPRPSLSSTSTLADALDDAYFGFQIFDPLCTLASAHIQLKKFDEAHATIRRIRAYLDGDFKIHFDQDPLEVFPNVEARQYTLSAQLAQAEGRNIDALAFWQKIMTDPYVHSVYKSNPKEARVLWKDLGGTDEGWAAFSAVPPLPPGTPVGNLGAPFMPWLALHYKLPELKLPGVGSRTWTNADFQGKTTLVYLWASWCGPCWPHLPAIQAIYNETKDRDELRVVGLCIDDEPDKLAAFMRQKKYTFPVMIGHEHVKQLLPHPMLGQTWIVDRTGFVRLQRLVNANNTERAEVGEMIRKLVRVSSE